ncbi:hypothetical protein HZA43_05530 [Candidatus Peregrinibacteria bacterium]|nr:hypothetical protein [Candidatus Peregrinibacteria bacterium]
MFKKALFIIGILMFIAMAPKGANASGKMEVQIGQEVTLAADEIGAMLNYKWVVTKDNKILAAQNQRELHYTFSEQGEYAATLSITDQNNQTRTTKISILSGDTYAQKNTEGGVYGPGGVQGSSQGAGNLGAMGFRAALTVLPQKDPDGRIHLVGNEGKVAFDLQQSTGTILEYRIDQNIYKDSDGNGIATDDIDNSGDTSYLTGKSWTATYKNEGTPKVAAEATLVDKDGKKATQQVEITFDPEPVRTGDPVATLDVSPASDARTQVVTLSGDEADASFYARNSTGNILEYRIDKDIFVDSDGDGNAGNDIDNLNDPSFKTGDIWHTTYKKTDHQIIAQLIVVGPGGKGSRVQRALVFGNPVAASKQPSEIHIEANRSFVRVGDPVEFQVVGLRQDVRNYTFDWDFNGDGTVDREIEGSAVAEYIFDQSGTETVKVKITDKGGNSGERKIEMSVKEQSKTVAAFTFHAEGGKMVFENQSVAAEALADKTLRYQWNFGDTNEENFIRQNTQQQQLAPAYEYVESGLIKVTLQVTDASGAISEAFQEVEVTEDMVRAAKEGIGTKEVKQETTPSASKSTPGETSGLLVKIIKVILYIVIAIISLLVVLIVGFIAFIKLQHPDLSLSEVIEELKWKILTMLGVHENEVAAVVGESENNPPPSEPTPEPVGTRRGASDSDPAPTPAASEPAVEGEVVRASPAAPSDPAPAEPKKPEETPPPQNNSGPIPDWLKNA